MHIFRHIKFLSLIGTEAVVDHDLWIRIVVSNCLTMFAFVMSFLFCSMQLLAGPSTSEWIYSSPGLLFGLTPLLNYRGFHLTARLFFVLGSILMMVFYSWHYGHDIGLKYMLLSVSLSPFSFFTVQEKTAVFVCIFSSALALAAIECLTWFHIAPVAVLTPGLKHSMQISYLIFGSIGVVLQGFLLFYLNAAKEKKLLAALAEQHHSAKLVALAEMAGGIAHEINNPVTIIYLQAVKFQRQFQSLPEIAEAFAGIEKVAMRIAKIIKGLRALTRDAEGDPMEPCLVATVIDDGLELCREKMANHGIELREANIPRGYSVSGRSVQLSQVILNLLSNAMDSILEAQNSEAKPWIAIEVHIKGSWLTISISDSGPGIPLAIRSKILQPFYTTKAPGKGSGLGLSISSAIVEAHGGRLYLDEAAPHTCFVVSLPVL